MWIARYDALSDAAREEIRNEIAHWPARPRISVLMPVSSMQSRWLRAAIASVESQLYPEWELCIADDATGERAIRDELARAARRHSKIRLVRNKRRLGIAGNANRALELASGGFVALLQSGDLLAEHALYWMAREIIDHPDTDLLFSDEDKIGPGNDRYAPYFKSDWNLALMLSQNAFGHLGVYRRSLVERVGGFRPEFDGAEDHDLVLRCARATEPRRIRHIPRILYHSREIPSSTAVGTAAKPHALEASRRAVQDFLDASAITATASTPPYGIRVDYALSEPRPLISILLPTTARQRPDLLRRSAGSVLERSTYGRFELLILVNEAHRANSERDVLITNLARKEHVRVLTYSDRPFNFAWVNNWAARQAAGSLLCMLNDDTEVITSDWLEKLSARVQLDKVACAGPMLIHRDGTIQQAGVILGAD